MRSEVRILFGAMLLKVAPAGPALTNAILVGCETTRQAALIDAPFDSSDFFLDEVEALGLEVGMILLTHSHWDHIAEAAYLKKRFKAPLYIHSADAGNLEVPGSDGLPLFQTISAVHPDYFLEEGQDLKVGELALEVIHTPGHTPGGVCFYFPSDGVLISGDTLFRGTIGNLSFPTAEPDKMWESLKKLAALPPETRVIPGHGDETEIGREKWLKNAKEYFS